LIVLKNENIYLKDINNENILAVLNKNDFINSRITKDTQGLDVFSFTIPKKDGPEGLLKFDYIATGNIIYIEELNYIQQYRISSVIKKRDGGKIVKQVRAEQLSYDLLKHTKENFEFEGTFGDLFNVLNLNSYGFTYDTEDNTTIINLKYSSKTNDRQILIDAIKQLEMDFYFYGKHLKVGNNFGSDNGAYISIGKNLQDFDSEIDEYDNIYYRVNLLELENLNDRKDTVFENLDSIDISDFVVINDPDLDVINEKLKILKYDYNPFYKKDSEIELSNRTILFTDKTITKDNLASAIRENPDARGEIGAVGTGGGMGSGFGDENNNMSLADDKCDLIHNQQQLKEILMKLTGQDVLGFCFDNADGKKVLRMNLKEIVDRFRIQYSPQNWDTKDFDLPVLEMTKDEIRLGFSNNEIGEGATFFLNAPHLTLSPSSGVAEFGSGNVVVRHFAGQGMYIETAPPDGSRQPAYIFISETGDIEIKNENNDCSIYMSNANIIQIESGTVNVLSHGNVNVESMGDILLTANGNISLNPAGKAFYKNGEIATLSTL